MGAAILQGQAGSRRQWLAFLAILLLLLCWLKVASHYLDLDVAENSSYSLTNTLAHYIPGKGNSQHAGTSADLPEYSIKPIVYVFPQFHPIPENDKFWGKNFTEWVNVQKLSVNYYGVDTPRPTEEVGFYNLLDLSTRKRWTDTIKKSQYVLFSGDKYDEISPISTKSSSSQDPWDCLPSLLVRIPRDGQSIAGHAQGRPPRRTIHAKLG